MSRYANKKILSIIMVICMIFTLLPMNTMGALADDAVTGEYNEWGDGVRTASGAAITKTAIEGVVYYNIWVGGNQVTSENQSNITGTGIEGTVTYDHDSHTLKLDNAIITRKHAGAGPLYSSEITAGFGIYAESDLIIELAGDNRITGACEEAYNYGIYTTGNLTISGTGKLNVDLIVDEEENFNSFGIVCGSFEAGVLEMNDGTVIVTAAAGGDMGLSLGVFGYDVIISGGTLEVNAVGYSAYGINGIHCTAISGGTVSCTATGISCAYPFQYNINLTGGIVDARAYSSMDGRVLLGGLSYINGIVMASADPNGDGQDIYDPGQNDAYKYIYYEEDNMVAVKAAKDAVVDGEVTVYNVSDQNSITTAVQSYVNSKVNEVASGVAAVVSHISDSTYNVELSRGLVRDSKTITMTINEIVIDTAEKLQDAIDHVISGGTITLGDNIILTDRSITIRSTNEKSFTINLNGKTLSGKTNSISADLDTIVHEGTGNVTIAHGTVRSGTDTFSSNKKAISIPGSGSVTLSNIIVRSSNSNAITKSENSSIRILDYYNTEIWADERADGGTKRVFTARDLEENLMSSFKYIEIKPSSATNYDIWVGGTLILNDAGITGVYTGIRYTKGYYDKSAIYAVGDLNIELTGESSINAENVADQASLGIYVKGDLAISGLGSLDVKTNPDDGTEVVRAYGIGSTGNLIIRNGQITVSSGNASDRSYGISGSDSVTISGGIVNAAAKGKYAHAIDSISVAISGGTVNAAAEGTTAYGIEVGYGTVNITGGDVIARAVPGTGSSDAKAINGMLKFSNGAVIAGTNSGGTGASLYEAGRHDTYLYIKYGPTAPSISTQPKEQSVNAGETAAFTVAASGTSPLSYQWQVKTSDGSAWENVVGANQASYTITKTGLDMNGNSYR